MNVNTQSINFVADIKLKNFIQKRFEKLDLFYDKIIQTDVYLKVENTSDKENKIIEAKISVGIVALNKHICIFLGINLNIFKI